MKKPKEKVDVAKKARQLLIAGGQIPFEQCSTSELFDVLLSLNPWEDAEQYNAVRLALVNRNDCTPLQNLWLLARLFSSEPGRVLEDKIAQQLAALPVEETLNLLAATNDRTWDYVWERIIYRPERQPSFSTPALIRIAQWIGFATPLSHAALLMLCTRDDYTTKPLEELLPRDANRFQLDFRWQWTIIYLLVRKPNYSIKKLLECLDQVNYHGDYWWCKEKALPLVRQRFGDVTQIATEELIELAEGLEKFELRELVKNALKDRTADLQRISSQPPQ